MFKVIVVLSVLIAVAVCAPAPQEYAQNQPEVTIVNYENTNDGSGNYKFLYDLSDGQHRDEVGELKAIRNEETNETNEAVVMSGSYSFVDAEGKTHTVTYTADENGYHPIVSK